MRRDGTPVPQRHNGRSLAGAVTEPPTAFAPDEATLATARRALPGGLCRECFGRLFGRIGRGYTNPERTTLIERALGSPLPEVPTCALCRGLFDRLDAWTDRGVAALAEWEHDRFACGSRWDPEILAHEEGLWAELGATQAESARNAFNREWGKRLALRSGTAAEPARPDIVLLADLAMGRVEATVLPVYLAGRYRKLDRTLPQTRWPCRSCRGRGCERCHGSGKMYAESVEELVGAPVLRATGGEGTRFHGMGREDIDARMLGRGRPFVLEILRPHHRRVDPGSLARAIAEGSGGRVEVEEFHLASADAVVEVKDATPEKSYQVTVVGSVPEAVVRKGLAEAVARPLAQRTPTRVAHRRADLVRHRRIVSAELARHSPTGFTVDLRTEAGTYVKEWVEGDGGRTEPSLSAILAVPLRVESLDVLEVHDRPATLPAPRGDGPDPAPVGRAAPDPLAGKG